MSDELMELPEGWEWTNVKSISSVITGKTPSTSNTDFWDGEIPFVTPSQIDPSGSILPPNRTLTELGATQARIIPENSTLAVCIGTVGKIGLLDRPSVINQQLNALAPSQSISAKFLYYWSQYFLRPWIIENASATVNAAILNKSRLEAAPVILPPLNEQKRIVAAIESLRERSQKARSTLSAIPELCDKFRQSVLAAAFRGDLTADWRERNPDFGHLAQCPQTIEEFGRDKNKTERNRAERIKNEEWFFTLKEALPQEWREVNFMDITWLITCGVAKKPDYVEDGVPFLSAQNAKPFKANLNDIRFISENDFKKFTVGGKPIKNDILYSRVGAKFGEAAKVVFDFDFAIYVSLTLIKPIHSLIDSDFLVAFLNSPYGITQARGGILGSGIQNLNVENVRHYRIPLPPIAEQQEISRRIDSLIRIVDSLEQTYQKLKHFLDLLDHAILAKAFRGELVEQDPNDEPASVLLERIRVDREQQMQGKAKKLGKKADSSTHKRDVL